MEKKLMIAIMIQKTIMKWQKRNVFHKFTSAIAR